jgi:hypothetical protein
MGEPPGDLSPNLLLGPIRVRPHDLGLEQQPGGPVRLSHHRHPLVRGLGAQDGRHVMVNDLDSPRVDLPFHGVIVPGHFAGTSFFAVQNTAFVSIRTKLSSLKSSGCPSDV